MAAESLPMAQLDALLSNCTEKVAGVKDPRMPYVALEHMATDAPDLLGIATSDTSTSTNTVFRRGDVLFGKLRPYLRKCVAAQFDGYCSTDILVLRANEGADPAFATKMMQSDRVFNWATSTSYGTKMPRTSWTDLLRLEVYFPPLAEQRRIAEILDTIDEAIRKTEQVIEKLKAMKQGLLHDLLTRGIDDNGELRPPPAQAPHLYKDSPLGMIPRGWEVWPFSDFPPPDRPYLKTGPFGSSLKGEHWVEEGVPVITIGALGEGEFVESELLFVSERTAENLSVYAVREGDIVFSRVADVGRSVVVSEAGTGWIISSNLMWISLDAKRVHPHFVWLNLSGNVAVRRQVRRFVNAGGREVANAAILNSMRLAWPSIAEQQQIVGRAAALAVRSREEQVNLSKLRTLKRGLMDDLLTGRVRGEGGGGGGEE